MNVSEAHRLAQLKLGARVVALMRAAFRLLDPEDLDATFADWLVTVEPIIANGRRLSAGIANAYLLEVRRQTVGFDGTFEPMLASTIDPRALRTSLLVTGPLSIKNAMTRGVQLGHAVDIAGARTAAAGMRHALDGGRETILESVRRDDRAIGWRRIASGKACQFCASLEGAITGEAAAGFEAHDGCSCSAEPVYR